MMTSTTTTLLIFVFLLHITRGRDPFGKRKKMGDVGSHDIEEASGLAASRVHSSVLYTHNDHGDTNRFFAIHQDTGKRLATFTVRGSVNNDWEDMAIGPCADDCAQKECSESAPPSRYCVYIADTGNGGPGAQNKIYMVREPQTIVDGSVDLVDTLEFTWDQEDAETLMIAPNGQLYIVSKVKGGKAKMAALPHEGWTKRTKIDMTTAVTLDIKTDNYDPQGGDISPNGQELVLICEDGFYYYSIPNRNYLELVGSTEPEAVKTYEREKSTEAICFSDDGNRVFVLPEGKDRHLYFYPKTSDIL